ncbi:hypothetical protein H5410_014849 [Solanum commersonii]|uniref:Uncharacterized protein n=1 Tax=Solanum commersonii TaxID=4109 RepID=A0A9J5ZS34_SOLCO|nr:hypothetical protein H5410_014849 [Solanum commersonii]
MAPKAENMAGFKRSRKGEAFGFFSGREPMQKFGKKAVERNEGIEEETIDMIVAYHPNLTGKSVDVTRMKALDTSHGLVLSAQERQARDDSVMARLFGMAELQLRIGGRLVTDDEMETLVDRYSLIGSATFLCKYGPLFWSLWMMMRRVLL